jgi:hypothetical protein
MYWYSRDERVVVVLQSSCKRFFQCEIKYACTYQCMYICMCMYLYPHQRCLHLGVVVGPV